MTAASGDNLRAEALGEARAWIGTPYAHQASCPGAGTDCLGLIRGIYRALYGAEPELAPPYTPAWGENAAAGDGALVEAARRHLSEIDPREAAPGDVLLFRILASGIAKHAGVLSGEARMIHAYSGRQVAETALTPWWRKRLAFAFTWPERKGL